MIKVVAAKILFEEVISVQAQLQLNPNTKKDIILGFLKMFPIKVFPINRTQIQQTIVFVNPLLVRQVHALLTTKLTNLNTAATNITGWFDINVISIIICSHFKLDSCFTLKLVHSLIQISNNFYKDLLC